MICDSMDLSMYDINNHSTNVSCEYVYNWQRPGNIVSTNDQNGFGMKWMFNK